MTDLVLAPPAPPAAMSESAAARLASLRQPNGSKRPTPAHTSKVFTAGISTTALFGMVAIMGLQSPTSAVQTAAPVVVAPTTTQAPVPSVPATPPIAARIPAPVPIPVAVPVAQPGVQTNNGRTQSNTSTNSSG